MSVNCKSYLLEDLCDFANGFAFRSTDYLPQTSETIEVFRMGVISLTTKTQRNYEQIIEI